jgi:hypothetical protein
VSTYRVSFDGEWQGTFEDRDEALDWARTVSETGRLVHVAKRRALGMKLVAIFPEGEAEEGRRLWKAREAGSGWAGGGTGAT